MSTFNWVNTETLVTQVTLEPNLPKFFFFFDEWEWEPSKKRISCERWTVRGKNQVELKWRMGQGQCPEWEYAYFW